MVAVLDDSTNWLIFILQPPHTIAELATCERVMTTRKKLHFSWVYTLYAAPRYTERDRLRRSSPCTTVLNIWQLFPTYTQHFKLNLVYDKDYPPVKGQRFDDLPFFSRAQASLK